MPESECVPRLETEVRKSILSLFVACVVGPRCLSSTVKGSRAKKLNRVITRTRTEAKAATHVPKAPHPSQEHLPFRNASANPKGLSAACRRDFLLLFLKSLRTCASISTSPKPKVLPGTMVSLRTRRRRCRKTCSNLLWYQPSTKKAAGLTSAISALSARTAVLVRSCLCKGAPPPSPPTPMSHKSGEHQSLGRQLSPML